MKNKIMLICLFLFCFFVNTSLVMAEVGYLTTDQVRVRKGPSTGHGIITELYIGDTVNVIDTNIGSTGDCTKWYKINYNNSDAYICGEFIRFNNSDIVEAELDLSKFPTSYHSYLKALHEKFPNWVFVPVNTGLNWDTVLDNESYLGSSLLWYELDQGYRSFDSLSYSYDKDQFYYEPYEGSNWYYASRKTVAYYLDPRNSINESGIFMFESLSYVPGIHTENTVKKVLDGSFMPNLYASFPGILELASTYSGAFMKAANDYNISPIHLASRVKQEMGLGGSGASTGAEFTYNNKTYSGLYNFYNIGAYGYKPTYVAGLIWANGGENGYNTSYSRPWTNPYLSIMGGAQYLADGYINVGQNTLYLQRFNVHPNNLNNLYTHQYMTSISAVKSEAATMYSSYGQMDLLGEAFVFAIPVYERMPDSAASLPNRGNPNNYLNEIKINNEAIKDFSNSKLTYDVTVPAGTVSVNISAVTKNSHASVSNIGDIKLNTSGDKTEIHLVVTAENGDTRTYNINFIKDPDSEEIIVYKTINEIMDNIGVKYNDNYVSGINVGTDPTTIINNIKKVETRAIVSVKDKDGKNQTASLRTGDKVNITSGSSNKTYGVVIYGDVTGDGEITILDLLRLQKHLLGSVTLSDSYLSASDVNKDRDVSILDLLKLQKHLLGSSAITQ